MGQVFKLLPVTIKPYLISSHTGIFLIYQVILRSYSAMSSTLVWDMSACRLNEHMCTHVSGLGERSNKIKFCSISVLFYVMSNSQKRLLYAIVRQNCAPHDNAPARKYWVHEIFLPEIQLKLFFTLFLKNSSGEVLLIQLKK